MDSDSRVSTSIADYPLLSSAPTPEQEVAWAKLSQRKRFILADQTGIGKTYSCLGAYAILKKENPDRHLIVLCTKSGRVSWEKEIEKHTGMSSETYLSKDKKRDVAIRGPQDIHEDVTILTHSSLGHFKNLLTALFKNRPVILAVDECHKIKNPKAKITRKIRYLIRYSEFAWGATATPMLNKLEELYHIFDAFIPGLLGEYLSFMRRFTIQRARRIRRAGRMIRFYEAVGHKNLEDLVVIIRPHFLKRSIELPLQFHYEQCEMNEEESDLYDQTAHGLLELEWKEFVARLPDLQLVTNNSVTDGKVFNESRELGTKEEMYLDLIERILKAEEAAITFTSFRKSLRRLKSVLENGRVTVFDRIGQIHVITGDTKDDDRQAVVERFDRRDVLLMTQAGGESLNLQVANHVIFYDVSFSLGAIIQVIGRMARMDSLHSEMHVYFLESRGTIDTYKIAYMQSNTDLVNKVLNGNANLPKKIQAIPRNLIVRMRKDLLWRKQRRSARSATD